MRTTHGDELRTQRRASAAQRTGGCTRRAGHATSAAARAAAAAATRAAAARPRLASGRSCRGWWCGGGGRGRLRWRLGALPRLRRRALRLLAVGVAGREARVAGAAPAASPASGGASARAITCGARVARPERVQCVGYLLLRLHVPVRLTLPSRRSPHACRSPTRAGTSRIVGRRRSCGRAASAGAATGALHGGGVALACVNPPRDTSVRAPPRPQTSDPGRLSGCNLVIIAPSILQHCVGARGAGTRGAVAAFGCPGAWPTYPRPRVRPRQAATRPRPTPRRPTCALWFPSPGLRRSSRVSAAGTRAAALVEDGAAPCALMAPGRATAGIRGSNAPSRRSSKDSIRTGGWPSA